MNDDEKFLIDRLADPLLRARDHAETLGMIAMAGIPAAVRSAASVQQESPSMGAARPAAVLASCRATTRAWSAAAACRWARCACAT